MLSLVFAIDWSILLMDKENKQSVIYINRPITSQYHPKEAASPFVVSERTFESSCAYVEATHSHLATHACPPKVTTHVC